MQYRVRGHKEGTRHSQRRVVAGEVVVVYHNQRIQYDNQQVLKVVVVYEVNENQQTLYENQPPLTPNTDGQPLVNAPPKTIVPVNR